MITSIKTHCQIPFFEYQTSIFKIGKFYLCVLLQLQSWLLFLLLVLRWLIPLIIVYIGCHWNTVIVVAWLIGNVTLLTIHGRQRNVVIKVRCSRRITSVHFWVSKIKLLLMSLLLSKLEIWISCPVWFCSLIIVLLHCCICSSRAWTVRCVID